MTIIMQQGRSNIGILKKNSTIDDIKNVLPFDNLVVILKSTTHDTGQVNNLSTINYTKVFSLI